MTPFVPTPRLRSLFERAVEISPDARGRWFDEAELDEQERAALAAMLGADGMRDAFVDTPAVDAIDRLGHPSFDAASWVGRAVGPYVLAELVGHGGSSHVFRAIRRVGEAEQVVALKLLNSHWLSADARRRFGREQQILAQLSHPGIARMLDAGVSDDGIPYIGMEYVDGLQLLEFARANALERDARLRLFTELCRAVDAAHRSLVVHRDLKPSNVLVTADGHIKVLDFGTAKLLECDDAPTETRSIALTPGYAAPEQYRPGPVSTSTDVYALGVIAAELLIGVRLGPDAAWPDGTAVDDAARAARRGLDADLAIILRAALASDPALRYPSAGHLADDVRRFLDFEPLAIRAPSPLYRMRKFASRHRGTVALASVSLIALATAFVIALWQARKATDEAGQARAELARANAMRQFMFAAFGETEPTVPRARPATVLEVVERAIDEARSDRGLSSAVRVEMLTRLGTIVETQGELERAGSLLAWNAQEAASTLGPDHPLALDAERALADNLFLRGDFAEAREHVDKLLARPFGTSEDAHIRVLSLSADLATKEHDLGRARKEGREALERSRKLGNPDVLRQVLEDYGNVLLSMGDSADALPVYQELLGVARARFGEQHATVAGVHASLARVYRRLGDLDAAERSLRAALAIDRKVHRVDDWRTALHLNALTMILKERRDFPEALETEIEGVRIDRATLGDAHPDTLTGWNNVGMLELLMENFTAAKAPLREAFEGTARRFGEENWDTAFVRGNYGYVLAESGEVAKGQDEMDHALATFAALPGKDHDAIATVLEKKARVALDLARPSDALKIVARIERELREASAVDTYWAGRPDTLRGEALLALKQPDTAVSPLLEGYRSLGKLAKPDPLLRTENALLLVEALRKSCSRALDANELTPFAMASLKALRYPPKRVVRLGAAISALGPPGRADCPPL